MKHYSYTPEKIAAMHRRNENFRGRNVDFNRLQAYRKIENLLKDLATQDDDVICVIAEPPSPRELVTIATVELERVSVLTGSGKDLLTRAMELADDVIFSCPDGQGGTEVSRCIRIIFGVHGIWKK